MWITYHLINLVPVFRTLGNIHWNDRYLPLDDNIALLNFSSTKYREIYENIPSKSFDIRYVIASLVIDHGDILFRNYSRYEQTCHLLAIDNVSEGGKEYSRLPKFYKKKVLESYPDVNVSD